MKSLQISICTILALSLLIACKVDQSSAVRIQNRVTLLVDGQVLHTTPAPVIRRGRLFIPVTAFRKIGLGVDIERKDKVWVIWPDSDAIVEFHAGRNYYPSYNTEEKRMLPGTPFIRQGVMMVPLKSWTNEDLTAEWDNKTKTVSIHRSQEWLTVRLEGDQEYREDPDIYETPILGTHAGSPPSVMIERAKSLNASGKWQAAVAELQLLASRHPFDWSSLRIYVDYWKAYPLLGEILMKNSPDKGNGYLYAGIGRAIEFDYNVALDLFQLGVEKEPTNPDLLFAIGWANLRQEGAESSSQKSPERLKQALEYYKQALSTTPSHSMALISAGYASLQLAELISKQGNYSEESKAEARPYLQQAESYFARYNEANRPNVRFSKLLNDIRRQLHSSQRTAS